ncbi:M48 family metallopeptidase [Aurantiacibacter gilvus]|uniref:M48 family metallopeptidase n=1 Tax=Aurantiacibacter gilvus TaxID=3139141 RepID=A0ABU9ID49_9SPHN
MLALAALLCSPVARAQGWAEVEEQDLRLARVAERIMIANAALCNQTMPITGLILHSADMYGEGVAEDRFVNGPLAIASLLPGSVAANAGLQRDDAIVAINGVATANLEPEPEGHLREAAFAVLVGASPARAVTLSVQRAGQVIPVSLDAPRGCRSLVEILLGDGPNALSDGRIIQLQYDFAQSLTDDQLAVAFAHELAHTVLEHRRRKTEAGIDNGSLLANLGRHRLANRQAEIEADRLSIHLLANAGYDPAIVEQFWHSDAGSRANGSMPNFIYPTTQSRADIVALELSRYLPLRRGPTWPGHLLEWRERGFASD